MNTLRRSLIAVVWLLLRIALPAAADEAPLAPWDRAQRQELGIANDAVRLQVDNVSRSQPAPLRTITNRKTKDRVVGIESNETCRTGTPTRQIRDAQECPSYRSVESQTEQSASDFPFGDSEDNMAEAAIPPTPETTVQGGAPFIADGDEFIDFPEEIVPLKWELMEAGPTLLTHPVGPLGYLFEELLHTQHDRPKTDLDDHAIGLQPIPQRPGLILECNERFLAPGFLNRGLELPTGVIWRPSLWVFGEARSAIQYYDDQRAIDPVVEWASRLDLFAQVNLSGTERVLLGFRPLDEEEDGRRDFSGYDLKDGGHIDGWNAELQTAFFEGDFGEIFPWLDPYDSRFLDYGFSVGRMPILAQQGLLINEDMIDALTITRNTLSGNGNLNLRMTGVYAWNRINRNSPVTGPNRLDKDSSMVALLTESDFYRRTINADVVYVFSGDEQFGDVITFGLSGIQRVHGFHNTYNMSLHVLASFPTGGTTNFADQGELLFAQTSWTPHRTEDLVYLNTFLAVDQFTSPARGPLMGGPLGQTGIVFSAPGLGRAGPPIGVRTNDTAGASLGYQLFFDHTRQQVIWEIGGQKEYDGPDNLGAIGTIMRYQRAIGQHYIFLVDGFVAKREGQTMSQGSRAEVRVKF